MSDREQLIRERRFGIILLSPDVFEKMLHGMSFRAEVSEKFPHDFHVLEVRHSRFMCVHDRADGCIEVYGVSEIFDPVEEGYTYKPYSFDWIENPIVLEVSA